MRVERWQLAIRLEWGNRARNGLDDKHLACWNCKFRTIDLKPWIENRELTTVNSGPCFQNRGAEPLALERRMQKPDSEPPIQIYKVRTTISEPRSHNGGIRYVHSAGTAKPEPRIQSHEFGTLNSNMEFRTRKPEGEFRSTNSELGRLNRGIRTTIQNVSAGLTEAEGTIQNRKFGTAEAEARISERCGGEFQGAARSMQTGIATGTKGECEGGLQPAQRGH